MGQESEPATKRDLQEVKQELSAKIAANGAKIDANGAAISRVAATVVKNSEQITQLTVKVDKFDGYFNRIITTLDGLAANYARVDQEQVVMKARLDRVESDVKNNTKRIEKIEAK